MKILSILMASLSLVCFARVLVFDLPFDKNDVARQRRHYQSLIHRDR